MPLPAFYRSLSPFARVLFCSVVAGALGLPANSYAQDSHNSTVLVLKDPTPRPLDLDKVYRSPGVNGATAPTSKSSGKSSAIASDQRKALILRASHQVSTLAAILQKAVDANSPTVSHAQEVQIAGLIELLAGDVHTAAEPASPGKDGAKQQQGITGRAAAPNDAAPLVSETAQLVSLAKDLEEGAEKLGPDTLSVSVLNKSSQVVQLAHILKQRLSAL